MRFSLHFCPRNSASVRRLFLKVLLLSLPLWILAAVGARIDFNAVPGVTVVNSPNNPFVPRCPSGPVTVCRSHERWASVHCPGSPTQLAPEGHRTWFKHLRGLPFPRTSAVESACALLSPKAIGVRVFTVASRLHPAAKCTNHRESAPWGDFGLH